MDYTQVNLEKGMYTTGKGFAENLEMLDPSDKYVGTELEGLDAVERQFKRYDIRVSGKGCDKIEKFYATTGASVLFPEFISRTVRKGIEENDHLADVIAVTTNCDGMTYQGVFSTPLKSDTELQTVAEGGNIPTTQIVVTQNLVNLTKKGRMLEASYEALRFQKLDVFSVMLRQIGAQIARSEFEEVVNLIVNGSNNFAAAEVSHVTTPSNLTYGDIVDFWNKFSPYNLTTLIAPTGLTATMLKMSEFKDSFAGQNFHATGKMITPVGARLIKSTAVPVNKIIGLDKSCAIEKVQAGGVITEYDKLIDRQLERATITTISGFVKLFGDAAKVLTTEAATEETEPTGESNQDDNTTGDEEN